MPSNMGLKQGITVVFSFWLLELRSVGAPATLFALSSLNFALLLLLLSNRYRQNQVAGADIVDNIQALDNLAKAGVYAIEVLGVHTIVADKELRATSVRTTVCHRQHATVVVLTLGTGLAGDSPARTACAITLGATSLNNEIGDYSVEAKSIVEVALGELNKVSNGDRCLFLVELNLHITLLGRNKSVFHKKSQFLI
jgi:hypothetical protein